MGNDNLWVTAHRHKTLLDIEKKSQELVDAMESLPDASAQLLGLKALLKPAEPVYVPLVSDEDAFDVHMGPFGLPTYHRAIAGFYLRKAADRLVSLLNVDRNRVTELLLREWADQEEKYNA